MNEKFIIKERDQQINKINKNEYLFLKNSVVHKEEVIIKFINYIKFKNHKVFSLFDFLNLDELHIKNKRAFSILIGCFLEKQKIIVKVRRGGGYNYYLVNGGSFDDLLDSVDSI